MGLVDQLEHFLKSVGCLEAREAVGVHQRQRLLFDVDEHFGVALAILPTLHDRRDGGTLQVDRRLRIRRNEARDDVVGVLLVARGVQELLRKMLTISETGMPTGPILLTVLLATILQEGARNERMIQEMREMHVIIGLESSREDVQHLRHELEEVAKTILPEFE